MSKSTNNKNSSYSTPIYPVKYNRKESIEPSNHTRRISSYTPIDPRRYSRRLPSFAPRVKCGPCISKAVSTCSDRGEENYNNPHNYKHHDGKKRVSYFDNNEKPMHCEADKDRRWDLGNNKSDTYCATGFPKVYSKYCDEVSSCLKKPAYNPVQSVNHMVYSIKTILEELLDKLQNIELNDNCLKKDIRLLNDRIEKLEGSKCSKVNKEVTVDRSIQSFNEYRHFRKVLMKELRKIQIYDINDDMVMTLRAIGKQTNQSIDRIFQSAFLNYVDWRFPQIKFQYPVMNYAQIRQMLLNEWKRKAYGKSCNILKWLR